MTAALRSMALALGLTIAAAAAQAAVITTYTNRFDVENIRSGDDVWLTSEVKLNLGTASLHYELAYDLVDTYLEVIWRGAKGNVLLHGGNGFGFTNWAISSDLDYVGLLAPTIPYTLLGGKADFTPSSGLVKLPCLAGKVCATSYYDWQSNAGGGGDGSGSGPVDAAAAGLPSELAGLSETRATISHRVGSASDPDASIDVAAYRFGSSVESTAGGFLYRTTVDNLTDETLSFEIGALSLAGSVDAHGRFVHETLSALGPGVLGTEATVTLDGGRFATTRFDALAPSAPVPEPSQLALGLAGLALLFAARRRASAA